MKPSLGVVEPPARAARSRNRRVFLVAVLALALLLVPPTVSYARALTAPGSATWGMRTVDWVRAHHGNGLVNAIENWYYARQKPAAGPPDPATLPPGTRGTTSGPDLAAPPALRRPAGVPALPGEGVWSPGRAGAGHRPLIYTSYLRPDPRHLSVIAGVAWIRAGGSVAHLVAGTSQPGGHGWPGDAAVPSGDIGDLVATFNSGFKLADIPGGFLLDGRTAKPLVAGQASFVIDRDGRVRVGEWGREVTMDENVVAVRQNLALVVDAGEPAPGLGGNAGDRWGNPHNQFQYTWRSGVGVDARGDLIYVAGNKMNLTTLAAAMVDTGIVRGMQLDIHPGMVSFSSWLPRSGGTSVPAKLLPAMPRPADRYLVPDQRDFFYLTAR